MPAASALIASLAAALAVAEAATPDHGAEIERAVFDLCPKVFTGAVALTDPAQVAAIGYTSTAPRETPGGQVPRAETGAGDAKIVIAGQTGADPSCSIWFGGPDNRERFGEMLTHAGTLGYSVSPPMRLGDGTLMFKLARKKGVPPTMIAIGGDAGGEFGGDPATTIILMK